MNKKLKIQFWKAEKALAMQILEQEGLPKQKRDGKVHMVSEPDLWANDIFLRGYDRDDFSKIAWITFNTEYELNAYLHWAVTAITEELFSEGGELKVGEMCEVKDYEDEQWKEKKLIAILPAQYEGRFIAEWGDNPSKHSHWDCARPIGRTEPKIEECGQLITYTWEKE